MTTAPLTIDRTDRAAVVRACETMTQAEVARLSGLGVNTVSRWVTASRKDPDWWTASTRRTPSRVAGVVAPLPPSVPVPPKDLSPAGIRAARTEELRQGLEDKLIAIAHVAADAELVALRVVRTVQRAVEAGDRPSRELASQLAVLEQVPLREMVQATTAAIKDVQTLLGKGDGGGQAVNVVFYQPQPTPGAGPKIIELRAEPPHL